MHPFTECPGAYLRNPGADWDVVYTVDGRKTAFELAWEAWFQYSKGHGIGDPPPPKLYQAVLFFEREVKSREALEWQASEEKRKKVAMNQKHEGAALVITGGTKR